jgi:hypothetical protein
MDNLKPEEETLFSLATELGLILMTDLALGPPKLDSGSAISLKESTKDKPFSQLT